MDSNRFDGLIRFLAVRRGRAALGLLSALAAALPAAETLVDKPCARQGDAGRCAVA